MRARLPPEEKTLALAPWQSRAEGNGRALPLNDEADSWAKRHIDRNDIMVVAVLAMLPVSAVWIVGLALAISSAIGGGAVPADAGVLIGFGGLALSAFWFVCAREPSSIRSRSTRFLIVCSLVLDMGVAATWSVLEFLSGEGFLYILLLGLLPLLGGMICVIDLLRRWRSPHAPANPP